MKQKTITFLYALKSFCVKHKKLLFSLCSVGALCVIVLVVICNAMVGNYEKYVLQPSDTKHVSVGMVLGAGITGEGKPYKELQARLDVAAQALQKGNTDKLILSGDNRFKNYNEPDAMKDYLVNTKHIAANKLEPDYAGRSTYESCERAAKIFGIKEVIIFSAGTHLPRAIFLCRHFGITAYGVSSGVEANNSKRREVVARVKAIFNVYVLGENTILGTPIQFN